MGIILVKNIKGGVGKSWITFQLAHLFAIQSKKILIITSDNQNNIPLFAGINFKNNQKGIESWIVENKGDFAK